MNVVENIYLVSNKKVLFKSNFYKEIDFSGAIDILKSLEIIQLDTETLGLDCHTKSILTLQLGNRYNQIVFDWHSLSSSDKQEIKEYLESDNILILGQNLLFDLTFLYKNNIWPKHIYDTMIAEQLIYLGYPRVLSEELYNELNINLPMYELVITKDKNTGKETRKYELSYSLHSIAKKRLDIDIDKSVRGAIITEGLTERVVLYAGRDVMYLEDIRDSQLEDLKEQNLINACTFECEFVKSLAYAKYCGCHLDVEKWSAKMASDKDRLNKAVEALNTYVLDLWNKDKSNYKEFITFVQPDLFGFVKEGWQCNINWSSSKQVISLFKKLGIKVKTFDKKTKKEKESVEEGVLAPQADKFPIIKLFLEYQGASKVVTTYGQNWLNAINPKTGRVHIELHPIGTDTSRVSSGGGVYKLNIQNLPSDAITRACFTAEKGNVWLSCDYQSQESRIIASVSNDKAMIDLFENGCGDRMNVSHCRNTM